MILPGVNDPGRLGTDAVDGGKPGFRGTQDTFRVPEAVEKTAEPDGTQPREEVESKEAFLGGHFRRVPGLLFRIRSLATWCGYAIFLGLIWEKLICHMPGRSCRHPGNFE
jgi:hypothetical protein|tara:strand:+ start:520 stop:849 length:330 start_codon:yes stop_codon:yes gene_type:complete